MILSPSADATYIDGVFSEQLGAVAKQHSILADEAFVGVGGLHVLEHGHSSSIKSPNVCDR